MTFDPAVLTVTCLVFGLAGLVKGVIGLGLPTISVGLLSLVMPPGHSAAILVIPSLVTNVWQLATGPHFGTLARRLWPMMAGILLGTWLAALADVGLLANEAANRATQALGGALMIYAALGLANVRFHVPRRSEWWLGPLAGAVTGAISTATGVFVIPAVPYLQAIKLDRDDMIQAQGLSFTVSTVALAASLADGLGRANLSLSFIALVPALLGMGVGQWLRVRIHPDLFRRWFLIGLLLLGAHLAFLH
jgi:uncharacterized membrane protein YfcA